MAVEVMDAGADGAALFCNTTDWMIGPKFDRADHAEDFLRWLSEEPRFKDGERPSLLIWAPGWWADPRVYDPDKLERIYGRWRSARVDGDGELGPTFFCHGCGNVATTEADDLSCRRCGEPRSAVERVPADA